MSAVIDKKAFDKISGYIADAKKSAKILAGRRVRRQQGLLHRADAGADEQARLQAAVRGDLRTGRDRATSIPDDEVEGHARDRRPDVAVRADRRGLRATTAQAVREATSALRNAAGNFYINDKPTGAVVGQQPFGGARASGTNDKAGSKLNLIRWVNTRTIKETLAPPRDYRYPFMAGE